MVFEDLDGGIGHVAVAESLEFIQGGIGVTDHLQQAPEIGGLLIAAVELELTVAGDDDDRRRIGAHMRERRIFVDQRLVWGHPQGLAIVVVAEHLAAERDEACHAVGIDPVFGKPALVQPQHVDQVAAGGMAGQEDLVRGAAVSGNVVEGPGHGRGGIGDAVGNGAFRDQPVAGGDDHEAALLEVARHRGLLAARQSPAVEPDDHGQVLRPFGGIDVQLAAFLQIAVRGGTCILEILDDLS